jgi:uncharacterized repeat protein (TIGR01451 family)
MTVLRRHGRGWLSLLALFLVILTSLLILEGEQVVTQARPPADDPLVGIDLGGASQAAFDLTKTAWPVQLVHGGLVTFTVTLSNTGPTTATVDAILDTLDTGLTFAGVLTGSDVLSPPQVLSDTLTWTGPFTLPAESALTLLYQVQTPPVADWMQLCNSVEISTAETAPPAAEACVDVRPEHFYSYLPYLARNFRYAHLAFSKSAFPTTVVTTDEQEIVYTVTVQNVGDTTGQLTGVHDVLPAGFSFLGMAAASDVTAPPTVSGQELTWSLASPIEIAPGGERRIIYRVSHSTQAGQYTNSVTISAARANVPPGPARATVTVEPGTLLEEYFESDTQISRWTPFLNYHRQAVGQFYWGATDGYNGTGGLTMNRYAVPPLDGEDGLLMYMADGAEQWTDYRVEAKVILRTESHPQGLWVRGQWEPSETRAQWVTGYYAMIGGSPDADTHYVRLLQLMTLTDCWGPPCPSSPEYIPGREINLYNFNNPYRLTEVKGDGKLQRNQWHTIAVEVRGANIKIWLNGKLYIDYTDPKEPFLTGTVGFKTYKADTVSYDDVVVTPLSD